jgi:hypothetical protein
MIMINHGISPIYKHSPSSPSYLPNYFSFGRFFFRFFHIRIMQSVPNQIRFTYTWLGLGTLHTRLGCIHNCPICPICQMAIAHYILGLGASTHCPICQMAIAHCIQGLGASTIAQYAKWLSHIAYKDWVHPQLPNMPDACGTLHNWPGCMHKLPIMPNGMLRCHT